MEIDENLRNENFMLTIASNTDLEANPKNNGSSFTSRLLYPVCGSYEVGLTDITFETIIDTPTSLIATTQNTVPQNTSKVIEPFFNIAKKENELIISHYAEVIVYIETKFNSILTMMDEIGAQLKRSATEALFTPIITPNTVHTRITYNNPPVPGFSLVLPADLSKALGFEGKTNFSPGTYISPDICDDTFFKQTHEVGKRFPIIFAGKKESIITVSEPTSHDLHDVVDAIVDAISETDHLIGIGVIDHILHVRIYSDFYSIRFSDKLNKYFGVSKNFEMTEPDNMLFLPDRLFPQKVKKTDTKELEKIKQLSDYPINKIFVTCNLIKSQQVGKIHMPYLQVLDKPLVSGYVSYKFANPLYFEINTHEIFEISISLKTDGGEVVETTTRPTVATLYFKGK